MHFNASPRIWWIIMSASSLNIKLSSACWRLVHLNLSFILYGYESNIHSWLWQWCFVNLFQAAKLIGCLDNYEYPKPSHISKTLCSHVVGKIHFFPFIRWNLQSPLLKLVHKTGNYASNRIREPPLPKMHWCLLLHWQSSSRSPAEKYPSLLPWFTLSNSMNQTQFLVAIKGN